MALSQITRTHANMCWECIHVHGQFNVGEEKQKRRVEVQCSLDSSHKWSMESAWILTMSFQAFWQVPLLHQFVCARSKGWCHDSESGDTAIICIASQAFSKVCHSFVQCTWRVSCAKFVQAFSIRFPPSHLIGVCVLCMEDREGWEWGYSTILDLLQVLKCLQRV